MKPLDHLKNGSLLVLLTTAIASCGGDEVASTHAGSGGTTTMQTGAGGGGTGGVTGTGTSAGGTGGNTGVGGSGAGGGSIGGSGGSGGTTTAGGTAGSGGDTMSSTSTGTTTTTPTTVRRPFLVGGSMRSARALARADWSDEVAAPDRPLDPATADLLARSWLQDALEEHASIAAFARFTMQMLALGAPPDLVARSQRASLDEIRHARACFALAARYGGGLRGPAPLVVHDSLGVQSLAEVAALAAEEGCVGETLGAALAQEQLALASDPQVIRALRGIARDEARHSELCWRFVKWAVMTGGDEVARAVADGIERAVSGTLNGEIRSYDGIDIDAWHAHGRVTCLEARESAARGIREIVRPCAALVLGAAADRVDFGSAVQNTA